MVFLNQQNIIPSFSLIEHPLRKPALGKQPVQHLIPRESRAQLRRLFYLLLQFVIDRRIHRLIVVLALPGEYLLLLVIYRHHIDLRIAVDVIEPVRADAGGHEIHRLTPAQGGKDILADNIIGGRSAVIQVTFLMEDRGFCKDVFATVEKPTRYYNRIFENYTGEVATWYSASPSIFESDCRISPQTIFEVVYQGRLCARDGNGDFEGKIPFVPFFEFERREAIRCSKKLPNLKGYEQMKEKLLSLPGGEQYSLHGACQDNWIYALSFGKETVQVIDTSEWMGRSYELIAVLYTHKPTGFQFTNYCIRPAGIISSSSRHDLLLYDWAEHQAGADSY